ncbi:MAG: PilZ domain-containing protein [Kofleriaceae bacterium]
MGAERRGALRVPVRGVAVVHANEGPLHGTLENLSQTGALFHVANRPAPDVPLDLELRLAEGGGWVSARAVRIEPVARSWRVAVKFDRVDPQMRDAIEASITAALAAARRRPILVIDDRSDRRASLIERLSKRGMTPLAPKTPLEAIDLLTRTQLHVSVCLLAPGFGVPTTDLAAVLSDSFPWVTTTEIDDDLDTTTTRALDAWAATPVARMGTAIV